MPKKGARQMREQGLEKTDNDFEFTSWPQPAMINQKNYYTEYLKRDDQILVYRLQNEESRNRMTKAARDKDRALANGGAQKDSAAPEPDAMDLDDPNANDDGNQADPASEGSRVIVIHPGSQNLRIGLASDVLPKTIPMVVARKADENEVESSSSPPQPPRETDEEGNQVESSQQLFGEDFYNLFVSMAADMKQRMRRKGRRIVPNCKEVAISFNKKSTPSILNEHNDFIDWTEPTSREQPHASKAPDFYTGQAALRIPEDSKPRYKLRWPLKYGYFNEADYSDKGDVFRDFSLILEEAIKNQVGVPHTKEWSQYGCVFVIPDLYDRNYVAFALDLFLRHFGFGRICFIQESLSGSFGAGSPSCVIVDVGAQKTSVCCVDEGLCVENSRINLRVGGWDITETFMKMMLVDHFPYADIDLRRRHDFLLAEELKQRFCTLSVAEFTAQQYEFYLRVFGKDTEHHIFKAYDEVILAPMALFYPELLGPRLDKARRRRALLARSTDLYDGSPNDPQSAAQNAILETSPRLEDAAADAAAAAASAAAQAAASSSADNSMNANGDGDGAETPHKARAPMNNGAGTPLGDDTGTPQPANGGLSGDWALLAAAGANANSGRADAAVDEAIAQAAARERCVPTSSLHGAILASIEQGARGDDKKMRDLLGGILPIGGGTLVPSFKQFLEEEMLEMRMLGAAGKDIMVAAPPREIDPQVLVWKGASVFGKLKANDSWISGLEYERLGTRTLAYKCMWNY